MFFCAPRTANDANSLPWANLPPMVIALTEQTPFAEWLSREMRTRKWNQTKLAAYLDIHPSGVNR